MTKNAEIDILNNHIISTVSVDKSFLMRTPYDGLAAQISDATAFHNTEPSLTKQEFADECDINQIMARFEQTGEIFHSSTITPRYGDFSVVPDYQDALNLVSEAQRSFDSLSSRIRERFHNNPAEFLEFVSDYKNEEEMRSLGILEPASVPVSPPAAASEGAEPPLATSPLTS